MQFEDLKATGLQVQYLKVCERKLWLHAHQLGFEEEDDRVQQGKVFARHVLSASKIEGSIN